MSIESITSEANNYHRKGDYSMALKRHTQALKLIEESVGKDHFDTADRYRSMGKVMDDAGDFDKAVEYLEVACSICDSLGTNEARLCRGEIFEIVGNMMYKKEDYAGAIGKLSGALAILKDTPGASQSRIDEIEYLIEVAEMMQGD